LSENDNSDLESCFNDRDKSIFDGTRFSKYNPSVNSFGISFWRAIPSDIALDIKSDVYKLTRSVATKTDKFSGEVKKPQ